LDPKEHADMEEEKKTAQEAQGGRETECCMGKFDALSFLLRIFDGLAYRFLYICHLE
jgi:hypothetical protein